MEQRNALIWRLLYFAVVLGYCLFYAPFGINESDGGFLTGFAWQVLSGKVLYQDVLYVRPPLPVWLRVLEIKLLPETWQTLGERWVFYLKIAAYSWLAADLLGRFRSSIASRQSPFLLATFAFVVSVHSYPPLALHTFDGILFSVLGLWLLPRNWAAATVCIAAATLCKQSFYPMTAVFLLAIFAEKGWRAGLKSGLLMLALLGAFAAYLEFNGLTTNYLRLVGDAAKPGAAFQCGVLNYLRINPFVAAGALVCLLPVGLLALRGLGKFSSLPDGPLRRWAAWGWVAFLCWLAISYVLKVRELQAYFPPYSQSRLLVWTAAAWLIFEKMRGITWRELSAPAALLAVSWCASISWGFQLPIQFAAPGVWAAMSFAKLFFQTAERQRVASKNQPINQSTIPPILALFLLLATFRYGYDFIYRDGRRATLTHDLGETFPRFSGIWTDSATVEKYRELRELHAAWPGPKAVLPMFAQADFALGTAPLLPTNWVVNRETNHFNDLIYKTLRETRPILFVEKCYGEQLLSDPEYEVTAAVIRAQKRLGETRHFWVYRYEN